MPQIQLTPAERKIFRADAHHLDPVVMIGGDGLTPAVVKETEAALNAHGLIKIRVLGDDRAAREAMFAQLADQLNAAPIQHIGKLLILWRPQPEKVKTVDEDRKAGPRDFKILKYSSRGGQKPEVKTVRVLGNNAWPQAVRSSGQNPSKNPSKKAVWTDKPSPRPSHLRQRPLFTGLYWRWPRSRVQCTHWTHQM